jgi:NAD(P)-dependent dehydrogenase (short-subunit alcohol dehydrogenase family)
MLLTDKVALITGGAKGMGRGMALKFAGEGCAVAIADISMKEATEVVATLTESGKRAIAIECDVTQEEQIKGTVEKVLATFGKIDILVNNAGGITSSPPIEEMTIEEWDGALNLNLRSQFLFSKFVVPQMKARKYGKIINFSSIGAIQPPHHAINYNTAKAGSIGFTADLANALAPFNINVNVILPGPIRTSFYDTFTATMSGDQKEGLFRFLGSMVPLQRAGTPEDIAGAALFLASDLSGYVTGQALNVAGGLPLQPPVTPPGKEPREDRGVN